MNNLITTTINKTKKKKDELYSQTHKVIETY